MSDYILRMEHFIDAHCHYDPIAFAKYHGECRFVCNAVCEDDWGRLISVASTDVRIHPAIGIHPWYIKRLAPGWPDRMCRILRENPNLMIGEVGMDNTRPNINNQADIFSVQYKIASDLGRSVHIHCVHSWDRLHNVLKSVPPPPAIVIHRYSASQELIPVLRRAVDDRIYFSFRDVVGDRMRKL